MQSPIPAELRTARMLLRPWRADDAAQLEPILRANTEHLGPWIPPTVSTPAGQGELAERLAGFGRDFASGRAWRYAAVALADGALLGEIDLFARDATARVSFDESDRAEIGYWLRADRTGEGFATEGARAALDVASDIARFTCVEIRCDPRNTRSAAVPARLGFHRVERNGASDPDADSVELWGLQLSRTPSIR